MSTLFSLTDAEREDYLSVRDLLTLQDNLQDELDGLSDEERAEANDLREQIGQIEEIEGYCDLDETLINESYFTEYAQQLADDIGAVSRDNEWPASYIDWEAAAEALQMDYTPVEIGDTTFYTRG